MKCIFCNENLKFSSVAYYCKNNDHFYYLSKVDLLNDMFIYFILKRINPNIEFYFNSKESIFELNKNDNCLTEIGINDCLIKINNINIDYNNFEELKKYAMRVYETLIFI